MRLTGPMVVIMWALANAGFALILRGYLGDGIELALFGGALTITFLFGAVMVFARGRQSTTRNVFYIPRSALPAVLFAAGVALCGLGLVFFPWPLVVAWVPIAAAGLLAGKDRREKPKFLPSVPAPVTGTSVVPRGEVPPITPDARAHDPVPLLQPPPAPDQSAVAALRTLARQAGEPAKPLLVRALAAAAGAAAVGAAAVGARRLGRGRQVVHLDAEAVGRLLEARPEERGRAGAPHLDGTGRR